ncbi:ABC transporter permease [uncultured Paraglaciecola sp.]|uniref:ABC transporter permease n=1 Tax=uncultured Paraglaciecola sp. TaxID=1765024 RepID=UPI0026108704|nr:ABC transporter permease [uncultured Paraglaciecola sp.]
MFAYNAKLAFKSLNDRPSLTILMVAAIAIGLGLFMTMLTLSHQASKIPIPHISEQIHLVQLDNREVDAEEAERFYEMVDLTYQDTENLLNMDIAGVQQSLAWNTHGILNVEEQDIQPLRSSLVATNHAFFSMFDVPFLYGNGWDKAADQYGQSVIVLSKASNDYLFGGTNSVGQQIRLNTQVLTVVGVLDDWFLAQKFYDRSYSQARPDQALIPSNLAFNNELPRNARFDCWSTTSNPRKFMTNFLTELKTSECAWITFWAKLPSNAKEDYQTLLGQYIDSQSNLGRFPRENQFFLTNINEQIALISGTNGRQQMLGMISYMFFAVCLINAVSILLAKFMRRTKEVSLRRALGAKKRTILQQHLIEVVFIGIIGGLIGIVFTYVGLQGMLRVSLYSSDYTRTAIDLMPYHQMDWEMIMMAFSVSVGCTLLVGLYPIWRICNVSPASQLKAQ